MSMGTTFCPRCGLKSNVRSTSIDTMRRCPNCGHKYILSGAQWEQVGIAPFLTSEVVASGLILALVVIGAAIAIYLYNRDDIQKLYGAKPPLIQSPSAVNAPVNPPTPAAATSVSRRCMA